MRKERLIATAGVAVILLAAAAANATVQSTSRRGDLVTIPAGSWGSASVGCPSGDVLVGGGWKVPYDLGRYLQVFSSRPGFSTAGTLWIVEVFNGSEYPARIWANAQCLSGLPSGASITTATNSSTTIPPRTAVWAAAPDCPNGSVKTAVGIENSPALYYSDRSITYTPYVGLGGAVFSNDSYSYTHTGYAVSICLIGANSGTSVSQYSYSVAWDGDNQYYWGDVNCPYGTVATGGGYYGDLGFDQGPFNIEGHNNSWEIEFFSGGWSGTPNSGFIFCGNFP